MQRWDYKTITIKSKTSWFGGKFDYSIVDEHLEKMGNYGWELVNVVAINKAYGSTEGMTLFFKRQKKQSI